MNDSLAPSTVLAPSAQPSNGGSKVAGSVDAARAAAPVPGAPKAFVLDTSVILHDANVLHQLEDNDIAIPIAVLEELDGFKKGNNVLSQHAREFIRRLDGLSEDDNDLRNWAPIGKPFGRLCVLTEESGNRQLDGLRARSNDHRILASALDLAERDTSRPVILITKDINLRVKARALGLCAEDYESVQVRDIEHLYPGITTEKVEEDELIDELYAEGSVPLERFGGAPEWPLNHHLILKGPSRSALATRGLNCSVHRVHKATAYGITPRNAEQIFALNSVLDDEVPLVTLTGGAGTGKTLLALAGALERRRKYRQILLARPVVPLSNRDLGYLPGDVDSKIGPYMQPLWDNLSVIRGSFSDHSADGQRIDEMLELEKLQITPLAYIRGRSLNRCFFIIDEAQNLTPHEIKTIITRAGEGTKIVFTGDVFQIDTPYLDAQSNGLSYLVDRMRGHALYAHVNLAKGERSELANLANDLL